MVQGIDKKLQLRETEKSNKRNRRRKSGVLGTTRPPHHNFKALKLGDQLIWRYSETSGDIFWRSKVVKRSVGKEYSWEIDNKRCVWNDQKARSHLSKGIQSFSFLSIQSKKSRNFEPPFASLCLETSKHEIEEIRTKEKWTFRFLWA